MNKMIAGIALVKQAIERTEREIKDPVEVLGKLYMGIPDDKRKTGWALSKQEEREIIKKYRDRAMFRLEKLEAIEREQPGMNNVKNVLRP